MFYFLVIGTIYNLFLILFVLDCQFVYLYSLYRDILNILIPENDNLLI